MWFHVLLFHVLHFHVLSFGPSFSRPAISCPANWSVNFTSVIFTSSIFSAPFAISVSNEMNERMHQSKAVCATCIVSVCLFVCLSVCIVTVHFSSDSRSAAGAWQDALQLPGTPCVWLKTTKCRLNLITMPIPFTPRALHCPTSRCQGSCTVIRHWPPRNHAARASLVTPIKFTVELRNCDL